MTTTGKVITGLVVAGAIGGVAYWIYVQKNRPDLRIYDNIKKTAEVYFKGQVFTVELGKGLGWSSNTGYSVDAIKDSTGTVIGANLKKDGSIIQNLHN